MSKQQPTSFELDLTAIAPSLDIMITTHNRLEDLKRTLNTIWNLSPPANKILVTCDGCTDGTSEWLRTAYPDIHVIVNEQGKGSVASRDYMLRIAQGDLILSLDDDSYPVEPDAIGRLKKWMQDRPVIAVATFPQRSEEFPVSLTERLLPELGYSSTYPNSGACYRRCVYQTLPGFNASFFHMYEEPDYALQCIGAGLGIYHTNIISIRHHYSAVGRNEMRTHHRHARNEFWSTLVRAPLVLIPVMSAYRMLSQFRFAMRYGLAWMIREPIWWYQGLTGVMKCLLNRRPVRIRGYRMWLYLLRKPTCEQAVWDDYLSTIHR
jgi:GT2 family glycosyltransferase